MIEAYPLYWPEGWTRTPPEHRYPHSRFRGTSALNRDQVIDEVRRLGGENVILSTNLPLRRDGLPYASRKTPGDPGVAVYFERRRQNMCFACDQYSCIEHNLRAIAKTIEALRGIERWGASDMMERAFRGFAALPEASMDWRQVLGIGGGEFSADNVEKAFRRLAHRDHPDKGGDADQFRRLVEARDRALAKLG